MAFMENQSETISNDSETYLAICVLTHNRHEDLANTLQAIKNLGSIISECLVLDNGSSDGTFELLQEISEDFPTLRFFRSEKNLGVSQGRNFLWERTNADLILAMDDDILVEMASIQAILCEFRSHDAPSIVSPKITEAETGRTLNGNRVFWRGDTLYEACFLLPRVILDSVGGFDPNLFVAGEGQDYAIRVKKSGFRIRRIDSAEVIHVQRIREVTLDRARRLKWIYSFGYVYFKNFNILKAIGKTLRLYLSMGRHDLRDFGLRQILNLAQQACYGAVAGGRAKGGRTK